MFMILTFIKKGEIVELVILMKTKKMN